MVITGALILSGPEATMKGLLVTQGMLCPLYDTPRSISITWLCVSWNVIVQIMHTYEYLMFIMSVYSMWVCTSCCFKRMTCSSQSSVCKNSQSLLHFEDTRQQSSTSCSGGVRHSPVTEVAALHHSEGRRRHLGFMFGKKGTRFWWRWYRWCGS